MDLKKKKVIKEVKEFVLGLHAMTYDGYFCCFIDYDNMKLQFIKSELERIILTYGLSKFYVVESSKNKYHAICFDKISMFEYKKILVDSSADDKFSMTMRYFGEPKVLRINKGMKLKFIVKIDGTSNYIQSSAHKKVYVMMDIIKPENFLNSDVEDGLDYLSYVIYDRNKRTKVKK